MSIRSFNSSILSVLRNEKVSEIPVWIMRQAGRYLPEYQKIREKHRLLELFHHPELIYEVTMMPLKRYPLDAAIVFSDILLPFDLLNIDYDFIEKKGPVVFDSSSKFQLKDETTVFKFLKQAIEALKRDLKVPLFGFGPGPLTLMSYYLEKGSYSSLLETKRLAYANPQKFHELLKYFTKATKLFLKVQIESGVDAVQLFESSTVCMNADFYRQFGLSALEQTSKFCKSYHLPVILFFRNLTLFLDQALSLNPTALSVDWQSDLSMIKQKVNRKCIIQGNLDPAVLYSTKQAIATQTQLILETMQDESDFIFNLGHGILPKTPVDHVAFLIDYVKKFRTNFM